MKTFLLFAAIIVMALLMFQVCSNKSTFGMAKIGVSDSTSEIPNIDKDSVLIFYAPWCGYCKDSMTKFEDAVKEGEGKIVLIDGTDEKNYDLKAKYGIQGFPTIIKGDHTKYHGKRETEEIVNFYKNKST